MQLATVHNDPAGLSAVKIVAAGVEADTSFQRDGDLQTPVPVKRGIDVVSVKIVPVYFTGSSENTSLYDSYNWII